MHFRYWNGDEFLNSVENYILQISYGKQIYVEAAMNDWQLIHKELSKSQMLMMINLIIAG